uniref:NADH-ubiquinone oxidoreductase chain 2 n=1 Tax=Chrysomeloidea sp. 3 KM-2017 TaxID=2219297 RepID=A0A346RK31_9CUCU|nr:NADH dehydrogenase subunit 2 [Chrysomeloidea sp. 3 KM-2017]
MLNFYKILFFMSMIFGTLMTISSYTWLSMWMGLEINLLSIIPLLKDKDNLFPSEAALKYFITQALASSILLFSIILSLNLKEYFLENKDFLMMIFSSALFIKMGAAPFHSWFPEVMNGLNWNYSMVLLTWQKIAPMIILLLNFKISSYLMSIIILSTIFSGIQGLNQIDLRKILAYSSINHISWMISSMINSQTIWMMYFLIYSIISLNIIYIFKKLNIFLITQVFLIMNKNKNFKFFCFMNFLSLGGLPPFLGFFPKWLIINNLIINQMYFLSILLIMFTMIPLFFYTRLIFSSLMINLNESKIFLPISLNFFMMLFNVISLSGLIFCTLILNLT